MCGTENRTQLPLAASTAGCCSTSSGTSPDRTSAGTGFEIEGLTCGHCVRTVENAVTTLNGVDAASVDLVPGGRSRLVVTGNVDPAAVREAVASAGYALIGH